jgi:ribosomal 50S subunit-recycling heat shock protein
VNGKTAKPAYDLKVGDIIELYLGGKTSKFEVLSLSEHVSKENASQMYRALSE